MGTSFAEMNRSDKSNAKKGQTEDFNAFKDFHESEIIASILAAWMEGSGMESVEGNLSKENYFISDKRCQRF